MRYLGKWYEIARLDHRFERDMSDVSATYTRRADGSVEVLNRGYDSARQGLATGDWARAVHRPQRTRLAQGLFGPFYGGYHVVALDPAYRWALVVGPDRDYFWILARERTPGPELWTQLVEKSRALESIVDQLIWVDQDAPGRLIRLLPEFAIVSMRAASPALKVQAG